MLRLYVENGISYAAALKAYKEGAALSVAKIGNLIADTRGPFRGPWVPGLTEGFDGAFWARTLMYNAGAITSNDSITIAEIFA